MTRFSRLTRVCMVCQRLLDPPWTVETQPGYTGLSHGICDTCMMPFIQPRKDQSPCITRSV